MFESEYSKISASVFQGPCDYELRDVETKLSEIIIWTLDLGNCLARSLFCFINMERSQEANTHQIYEN
jgi:hypothetical protein